MRDIIQTFEPNELGRDFVIGDLHGAWACFENLLKNINFDPTKDRMFSVGDLEDRGPESLRCLQLLYEPWFHAVYANHEQMMYEAFNDRTGGYAFLWTYNGGAWGQEALNDAAMLHETNELHRRVPSDDSMALFNVLEKVAEMPLLITIKMKDGRKFHVIHAELPPGKEITDEILADPKKVKDLATIQSHDGDYFQWGRFLFLDFYRMDLTNEEKVKRTVAQKYKGGQGYFNDKLSHIISGHTIMQRPLTILGQTNIDTCAYGSMKSEPKHYEALTCIELGSWSFYQATPTEFRTVEPLVVNKDDTARLYQPVSKAANAVVRPFGQAPLAEGIDLLTKGTQ